MMSCFDHSQIIRMSFPTNRRCFYTARNAVNAQSGTLHAMTCVRILHSRSSQVFWGCEGEGILILFRRLGLFFSFNLELLRYQAPTHREHYTVVMRHCLVSVVCLFLTLPYHVAHLAIWIFCYGFDSYRGCCQ